MVKPGDDDLEALQAELSAMQRGFAAAVASGLVAEAVALGVQDERLGHAIHLVVRPTGNSDDPESGLRKALQKELPNFMQPHVIHWRDTLPLNPNGKLDRTAIATEIGA